MGVWPLYMEEFMRKILVTLLALVLALTVVGCSSKEDVLHVGRLTLLGVDASEFDAICLAKAPEAKPVIRNTYYNDLTSLLLGLDRGDVALADLTVPVAEYISAQNPGKYEITPTETKRAYSIMLPSLSTDLQKTLNDAIDALAADGTLDALKTEYIDGGKTDSAVELPTFEERPTVRMVVTGDLPPMDFMSADNKPAGYNVALLAALAEKTQINFELISSDAGSRTLMITSGKADAVFWAQTTLDANGQAVYNSEDIPNGMVITHAYLTIDSAEMKVAAK